MKYFAKIDENNLVLNIDVLNDAVAPDEATGITFLKTFYKEPNATWKSCNKGQGATPGTVARVGGVWDEINEGFWPLQPYPSWIKNNSTWQWEAPITYPTITELYSIFWDENNVLWKATRFNNDDDPIMTYTWNSTTLVWEDLN
tara:strand:+ start:885 stop:1316 length:432 start_codon:yes stop_codon:yes gene_type:complete